MNKGSYIASCLSVGLSYKEAMLIKIADAISVIQAKAPRQKEEEWETD